MLKILYSQLHALLFAGFFLANTSAQIEDNFDSYTTGQRLACQNPAFWTTWSNSPCSVVEDAMVSNAFSLSTPNSVVITPNRDLVKLLGDQKSGTWYLSLNTYIPSGKHGYFSILSRFSSNSYYAMECIFSLIKPGQIRLLANHKETNFPFQYDTWNFIQIVVNLDLDLAEFWANGNLVLSWPWTQGSSNGTGALVFDAIDFYGLTSNDQMYVDNFWFHSSPATVVVESDKTVPSAFSLEQNYPNPFNPVTTINYSLPTYEKVTMKVYDVLGREITTLVNEEKAAGSFTVNFEGSNLTSGVYFYSISAGKFNQVKKMILTK